MPFRTSDVFRSEIITAPELLSDGYGVNSIYLSSVLITTSVTQTVTVQLPSDDVSLIWSQDYQVDTDDIVYIFGTSPGGVADGYYTINQVLTDVSFTVNETIPDSTDGYIQFRYPSGAKLVGFNPTGLPTVQANNVQDAIAELDDIKISAYDHERLRQLIHFLDNGPGDGFAPNAYREILPYGNPFPTSVTWYTDSGKSQKIVEKLIALAGPFPTSITWNMYAQDGVTIVESLTDTITYSGPFEIYRVRTINL